MCSSMKMFIYPNKDCDRKLTHILHVTYASSKKENNYFSIVSNYYLRHYF